MKKLIQFTLMFAATSLFVVACDKPKEIVDGPDPVSLTLIASGNSVAEGSQGTLTVSASGALEADLIVNVASSSPSVTVPATLTIEAGKNSATGTFSAVSKGSATITINADGVKYAVPSVNITVTAKDEPDPGQGEYATLYATGTLTPTDYYKSFVAESEKFGKVYPGCLYYHNYDKAGGTATASFKSTIDYYGGSVVGKQVDVTNNGKAEQEVFITSVPEGTVINDDLAWHNYYTTYMRFPILVKEGDAVNSLPDGTHFIVVKLSEGGDPNQIGGYENAVYVPCWMKIKVTGMNVEVLDGAMCLDDSKPFKVGDK